MDRKTRILIGAGGAAALGLTAAAALALAPERHGPMAMFDADNNQLLTLAEMRQGAQTMFAKVDTNKDGRITEEEFRAHHRDRGAHGGPHRGGPGGHAGKGGPDGGPGGHRGPLAFDKDGDGALTLAEVEAGLGAHFTEADANRDGSVTQAEMDAA